MLNNIGVIHERNGNNHEAKFNYEEAHKIAKDKDKALCTTI